MSTSPEREATPPVSAVGLPVSWTAGPRRARPGDALRTQCQIIAALAIREMEADYARFKLGYFWALVEPSMYIAILTAAHVVIRQVSPSQLHSMTPMLFIVLGVMPWLAFARTMTSTYRIIYTSSHMREMPGITTLDVIAAHAFLKFATYNGLFLIFLGIAMVYEHSWPPRNLLGVLLYFNAGWLLGVSFGMTMIPVHRAFPAIEHFMILVIRAGFWTAGLFFIITQFPSWAWPWMTWNPMLHVTELARSAWFPVYDTPVGSPSYILLWILGLGVVGLAADRLLRKKP